MLRVDTKGLKSIIAAIGLLCLVLLLMPNSAFAAGVAASQSITGSWVDSASANCATDPPANGTTETIVATFQTEAHNKGGVSLTGIPVTVNNAGSLVTGDITSICAYSAGVAGNCQNNPTIGTPYTLNPTDAAKATTYTIGITFAVGSGGHTATVTVGDLLPAASDPTCGQTAATGYNDCISLPQTTSSCTAAAPSYYDTADGTDVSNFNANTGSTENEINLFTTSYSGGCSSPATSFVLTASNTAVISAVRIEDTAGCGGSTLSSSCTLGGSDYTCAATTNYPNGTYYVCVDASGTTGSTTLDLTNVTGTSCTWNETSVDSSATMTVITPPSDAHVLETWSGNPGDVSVPVGGLVSNFTMATITTSKSGAGADINSIDVAIGGTVVAADVAQVCAHYNSWNYCVNNPSNLSSINIDTTANSQLGDLGPWTFSIDLNDTAQEKTFNMTVSAFNSAGTVTDNTAGGIPETTSPDSNATTPATNHNLGTITDYPGNVNTGSDYVMVDIASSKGGGGTDVTSATVSISGLLAADVNNVSVWYGGTKVGESINPSSLSNINIATAGSQVGGSLWEFKVNLAASADTKTFNMTVINLVGSDNVGLTVTTSPDNTAVAPSCNDTITTCDACHPDRPNDSGDTLRHWDTGSVVGDHLKHLSACSTCHVDPGSDTNHRDGMIDMLGTINGDTGGTYSKGTSFAQSSAPTTGTCDNISCHGGSPTPTWGVGTIACNSCHAIQPVTGSHTAHLDPTTGKAVCADCHDSAVQGSSNSGTAHSDKNVDVFDATDGDLGYPSNKTGTALYTCTSAVCHNDGRGTLKATPTWGTAGPCEICHALQPATGSHSTHLGLIGVACNDCHDGAIQGSSTPSAHGNKVVDVFDASAGDLGYPQNKTMGTPMAVCSSASCHDNGRGSLVPTPTWGTPGSCGMCHGDVPGTGSHAKHVTDSSLACEKCHDSAIQGSSNSGGNHTDGDVDVFDSVEGDLGYPANKTKGSPMMVCGSASCHDDGTGSLKPTPTWGTTATACAACHQAAPTTGSHTKHLAYSGTIDCADCHDGAIQGSSLPSQHGDDNIDVFDTGPGDLGYTQDVAKGTSTWEPCDNMYCHGSTSPTWGQTNSGNVCTTCHGSWGGTSSDTDVAPPRDTAGTTVASDTEVGAHRLHIGTSTITNFTMTCATCHTKPTSVFQADHLDSPVAWDGQATISFGSLATGNGSTPIWSAAAHTCTNTYCHEEVRFGNTNHSADNSYDPATTVPVWSDTGYQSTTAATRSSGDCGKCHFYDTAAQGVCSGCHDHVDSADESSFDGTGDVTKHMDQLIQGAGDCIGCHSGTGAGVGKTNNRRAVGDEFGLDWGHKNSSRAAVTVYDCGVCHMEGAIDASEKTTGSADATYHKNGRVELRNPDSSTGAMLVQFNTGEHFNRNVTSNSIETRAAEVVTFCLACHDGDGSVTTSGDPAVTTETTMRPWGDASVTVSNIEGQFNSTVTFHPVTQLQNNGFADNTGQLASPWDGGGSTHYKITCWDCHNKATAMTDGTVTAHGASAADHMRATAIQASTAVTPLCVLCHPSSKYGTGGGATNSAFGTAVYDNGGGNGGADHGWALHGKMDAILNYGCHTCHGGRFSIGTRKQVGNDVHGSNVLGNGSATWPSGAAGYAFFRNTDVYSTSGIGFQPAAWGATSGKTPTCEPAISSPACNDTGYHNPGNGATWAPGGTY